MKKIRLDLEALKVESLVTSEGGSEADGTVFAMAATNCDPTCNEFHNTCSPDPVGVGQGCGWDPATQNQWTLGDISCTGGGNTNAVGCLNTEGCTEEGETCDDPDCRVMTEGAGGW